MYSVRWSKRKDLCCALISSARATVSSCRLPCKAGGLNPICYGGESGYLSNAATTTHRSSEPVRNRSAAPRNRVPHIFNSPEWKPEPFHLFSFRVQLKRRKSDAIEQQISFSFFGYAGIILELSAKNSRPCNQHRYGNLSQSEKSSDYIRAVISWQANTLGTSAS